MECTSFERVGVGTEGDGGGVEGETRERGGDGGRTEYRGRRRGRGGEREVGDVGTEETERRIF